MHRLNTALEESLKKINAYQQKKEEIHKAIMRIDKIGLTHSQWKTVDRALSSSNARNSEYGEKAYMHGFKLFLKVEYRVIDNDYFYDNIIKKMVIT